MNLPGVLRNVSLQSGYTYSLVQKPLPDVSINRSNGFVDAGHALTKRWYVHGAALWQETHGGLRIGSPPAIRSSHGELNTRARFAQRDRVLSTQYWHAEGCVA